MLSDKYSRGIRAVTRHLQKGRDGGTSQGPDIRGPARKLSSYAAASWRLRFLDAAHLEFSSGIWLSPAHRTSGSVTCN